MLRIFAQIVGTCHGLRCGLSRPDSKLLDLAAVRKLDQLDSVDSLDDLKIPPDNRLETLAGDREGEYSIRINQQYRICFIWTDEGPAEVEIVNYH